MLTYTLKLRCSRCNSDIAITGNKDDKVQWRIDGKITAMLTKARRWIAKHPKSHELRYGESVNPPIPDELEAYVGVNINMTFYLHFREFHFIDCPACGGRAYLGSATSPPGVLT